jgi:hypothetical protein
MQAYVNDAFLNRRRKIAKWGNYIGLGALFGGLFTVSRSTALSSTLLLIGVFGASIGAYMANRYIREPRADQLLAKALDGLDKRYTLFSYSLPVDQAIFSHHGLTVLVTRPQPGMITYSDGRWHHRSSMRRLKQLVGEPSVGSPEKDLQVDMDTMRRWVAKQGLGADVPVNGAVVFTNENATVSVQGLGIPAVSLSGLATLMRDGLDVQAPLSTSQRREVESKLDELVGKV